MRYSIRDQMTNKNVKQLKSTIWPSTMIQNPFCFISKKCSHHDDSDMTLHVYIVVEIIMTPTIRNIKGLMVSFTFYT